MFQMWRGKDFQHDPALPAQQQSYFCGQTGYLKKRVSMKAIISKEGQQTLVATKVRQGNCSTEKIP